MLLGITLYVTEILVIVKFSKDEFPQEMSPNTKLGTIILLSLHAVFSIVMSLRIGKKEPHAAQIEKRD